MYTGMKFSSVVVQVALRALLRDFMKHLWTLPVAILSMHLQYLVLEMGHVLSIARLVKFLIRRLLPSYCTIRSSLIPRPHPARVSLAVLKAIHAAVGFGSGTETTYDHEATFNYVLKEYHCILLCFSSIPNQT